MHALRMMMASGSSSSSTGSPLRPRCTAADGARARVTSSCCASAMAGAPAGRRGAVLALNSWSCVSRLMARRPELLSRSMRMLICSSSGLLKKRLAAVLIISSESPTETMALASTRTLMGCGTPRSSRSAVWSVMSRSTLMALLLSVVPVVSRGTSQLLPGPRKMSVLPLSQLTMRMVPASTLRRKPVTIIGMSTKTASRMPRIRIVDMVPPEG